MASRIVGPAWGSLECRGWAPGKGGLGHWMSPNCDESGVSSGTPLFCSCGLLGGWILFIQVIQDCRPLSHLGDTFRVVFE